MANSPALSDHSNVDNADSEPAPWMQTAYNDSHLSFASQVSSEYPPRYSAIELTPHFLPSMNSPSYSTFLAQPGDAHFPLALPEPAAPLALETTSLNQIAESITYPIVHPSNEIQPYPIDVQPNFNPDSKEVRANLNLLPLPFHLSQPGPSHTAISPPQNKKAGVHPDEKARQTDGAKSVQDALMHAQARLQDVHIVDPQTSIAATPHRTVDTTTDSSLSSPQTETVKHTFQLKDSRGVPFLIMILDSKARNPQSTPLFYGGDSVGGQVYLSVNRDSGIQAVTLTVVGQLVTSAYEDGIYTFLEQTITLWSKSSSSSKALLLTGNEKGIVVGTKLSGGHSWPISFRFPDNAKLNRGKNIPGLVVNIPQSFLESTVGANIDYELVLRVSRGRFKSDFKLRTPLIYIPRITPEPPSLLMQLAYSQNAPLAGPKVDREGWMTVDTITTRGKFDKLRDVDVRYTLSLANPLCYTRGSVIPLSLTIDCQDSEVLDELSSPNAVSVVLKRRTQFVNGTEDWFEPRHQSDNNIVEGVIAGTTWWVPAKDGLHATTERRVEGEIHLKDNLQISCDFPLFTVEYFVTLQVPRGTRFQPDLYATLATQRIRVGTFFPSGCPTPRSFTTESGKRRTQMLHINGGVQTDDNVIGSFAWFPTSNARLP